MKYQYTNQEVKEVSEYLQKHMTKNFILSLTADQCAELLTNANILPNTIGPKPGFNFREMLRQGRDGKINFVLGAKQEKPNARWSVENNLIMTIAFKTTYLNLFSMKNQMGLMKYLKELGCQNFKTI